MSHVSFSSTRPAAQRGSALITVMMLSLALIMIVSSILGYSLNERRLNYREAMRLEARNAAEALSEHGLAQVRQLMENRSDFTPTRFTVDEGQIVKPATSFWGGSNVITDPLSTSAPELIIGLVRPVTNNSNATLWYFDPNDPNNEFEPLRGRYALRYDVQVISKATVNPPTGGAGVAQTCYMTQTLSARASPLFSHAIFYNMDLEFMPGASMTIVGPVHTNGKLYVRSQSSLTTTSLNFTDQVTTAKGLYAADQRVNFMQRNGSPDTTNYTSQVTFVSSTGSVTGLYKSTSPTMWRDQAWGSGVDAGTESAANKELFRVWASQTYQGNLQSEVHGVPTYNPVAIGNYEEGVQNDAHKLIEPSLLPSDGSAYNIEVENQKYARLSGIHIIVNPDTASDRTGRMPNGTTVVIKAGTYRAFSGNTELVLPGQAFYGLNSTTPNGFANKTGMPFITLKNAQMTDMRRSSHNFAASRSATNAYSPRVLNIIEVDMTAIKRFVDRNLNATSTIPQTYYLTGTPPADGTTTTAASWANYIFNGSATPTTTNAAFATGSLSPLSNKDDIGNFANSMWNGAIYIQSVDAPTRKNSGVRLINGRGRLASAGLNGLTIATNDALYVLGHYNADGDITSGTGPTSSARAPEPYESPCSVICDAFTILSQPVFTTSGSGASTKYAQVSGWNDGLSDHVCDGTPSASWATTQPSSSNLVDGSGADEKPTRDPVGTAVDAAAVASDHNTKFPSSNTELSTAIMTGLVPSRSSGSYYSGGAHNFPRFLENNSAGGQRTVAIRGSLVAMYDSTVAIEPWSLRVYDAPIRLWGFNDLFKNGQFPPLTPKVMSYRRTNFNDIKKSEYTDYKVAWGLTP